MRNTSRVDFRTFLATCIFFQVSYVERLTKGLNFDLSSDSFVPNLSTAEQMAPVTFRISLSVCGCGKVGLKHLPHRLFSNIP